MKYFLINIATEENESRVWLRLNAARNIFRLGIDELVGNVVADRKVVNACV